MNNGKPIENFNNLYELYKKLCIPDLNQKPNKSKKKWMFRGDSYHENEDDDLKTSLQKAFDRMAENNPRHKHEAEKDIIRSFQRKYHLYENNVPSRADILQWLAIMQHHGAPTRSLDWTYSFWVAVHFATSRRNFTEKAMIWAIDQEALRSDYNNFHEKHEEEIQAIKDHIKKNNDLPYCDPDSVEDNAIIHYLMKNPSPMICISGSYRRNQRLIIQQGIFLTLGDITKSFHENLNGQKDNSKYIQKIVICLNNDFKKDLIRHLRQMNMNNAVLFPGLDGFSESLWTRVSLPKGEILSSEEKHLSLYEWGWSKEHHSVVINSLCTDRRW